MHFLHKIGCRGRSPVELRRMMSRTMFRSRSQAICALVFCLTVFAPAYANDQNDMKDFLREQRQEERRRQREEAREAREQELRAAQLQREQERREAQEQLARKYGSGFGSSGSSSYGQGSVRSGSSSTSDSADMDPIGDKEDVKRWGSSSTSSRYNKKKGATQSNGSRQIVEEDDGPPPTVEKWWKSLTAPAEKPVEDAVDTVTDGKAVEATKNLHDKTADKNASVPKPAILKPAIIKPAAAKVTSGGTPEPIAFLDVPLPEVLAIDATAETVQRAQSLGFTTAPATKLTELNFSVTKLLPPKGMSAGQAQALLQAKVPGGSFAPNQKYRIYRTASGTETKPSGVPPTPSLDAGPACGADRCFARDIIGWKPELGKCVSGMKVGIIDTSVDVTHPAFARKKIEIRHFGQKDRPGPDWHGTGVVALLAGDGQSTTPGLIPDASFYVADIFYAGEDKGPASDTLSMLRAFNWLEAKGVRIINMSLSGPPDALIQKAVAKLSAKGILLVAAAGNDGPHNAGASYPAAYDDVIAVTAVNKNMQNYRYANRGSYVDVAAPGVAIWTALPGAQHGYHSGTSFATPYVTASLAAIYSRIGGQKPDAVMAQLQYRDLGDAGADPVYGRGLLVAPTSCTGGQIAAAPQPPKQPSLFSLFETSSAPAAEPVEQLPWLGLQEPGN